MVGLSFIALGFAFTASILMLVVAQLEFGFFATHWFSEWVPVMILDNPERYFY